VGYALNSPTSLVYNPTTHSRMYSHPQRHLQRDLESFPSPSWFLEGALFAPCFLIY
jgi:hypothetical protein